MANTNRIKKNILIFGVFGVLSAFAQEKKWTLQECITQALENNISVRQNENILQINEQDIIASKGQFLPSISANLGHNLSVGNAPLFQGQFVDRVANSSNLSINAQQTIFNGFRLTNLYKQAQLNLETQKLELNRIKDDIALNVANAYLNVLFNKENLETAKTQFQFSVKRLAQVRHLVDLGVEPKVNFYDARATISRDAQQVTLAENNFNLALLSLSQLIQVPYSGFDIEVIDIDTPSEALLYNDINPILNYALEHRNEIKIAEKDIENSKLSTKISKSGFYPTITGDYSYGSSTFFTDIVDNEPSFLEQLDNQKSHRLLVNINIPIFSRYQNKTSLEKSLIQEKNSKLNLDQAKLTIQTNLQLAYADAQAAFKAYEAAKKSLEWQELILENSKERYDIGNITSFDLEQIRVQLVNAKSSLINAKYDFIFKTKVLDFYMGKSLTN